MDRVVVRVDTVGVCGPKLVRLVILTWFFWCFFFQAEDGIRDRTVTGVQTCALPIYAQMRMLVFLGALPYFLLVPVWSTLLPIYAKDVFVAGPQGLGFLLTGVGIGGTFGGLAANALARAERQALLQAVWIVLMGAAILGLAASPTLLVAAL